jgi:molybdenum cofactor cytidylyltransferase
VSVAPIVLIPAAGSSRRMRGADKLLEKVHGTSLLRRQAKRAAATGWTVCVTVGLQHTERASVLQGLNVTHTAIDGAEGMSASLRFGAKRALNAGCALMVVLPDMPDITTSDLMMFGGAAMSQPDRPHRGMTQQGVPGHPVWLPHRVLAAALSLHGDQGARAVLAQEDVGLIALPGQNAITDLDTPEAWAAWRSRE